jgi:hypothetical protein
MWWDAGAGGGSWPSLCPYHGWLNSRATRVPGASRRVVNGGGHALCVVIPAGLGVPSWVAWA